MTASSWSGVLLAAALAALGFTHRVVNAQGEGAAACVPGLR